MVIVFSLGSLGTRLEGRFWFSGLLWWGHRSGQFGACECVFGGLAGLEAIAGSSGSKKKRMVFGSKNQQLKVNALIGYLSYAIS